MAMATRVGWRKHCKMDKMMNISFITDNCSEIAIALLFQNHLMIFLFIVYVFNRLVNGRITNQIRITNHFLAILWRDRKI